LCSHRPFLFFSLELEARSFASSDDQKSNTGGLFPPDAFLFVQAATKRKQKVPCHCVGHAVTDGRSRLKFFDLAHLEAISLGGPSSEGSC
jgi:hypothetical protein